MAFNLRFGKGNNPKTGHGIPSALKQMVEEEIDVETESPIMQTVGKKIAYDIKEASNQKLKPGARKHYAENAQAAMKNKKKK
jgi:hypothetical protein